MYIPHVRYANLFTNLQGIIKVVDDSQFPGDRDIPVFFNLFHSKLKYQEYTTLNH